MTIIWCVVPEIWSLTQNFFCRFGPFLGLLTPSNKTKNYSFKKMKKTPWDIIIVHNCTKNHDHLLYCFWHMVHDGWDCYFSFWTIFCPFTPPHSIAPSISQKNQNFKNISKQKRKNTWGYYLTHVYQKLWLDDVWFLRYS